MDQNTLAPLMYFAIVLLMLIGPFILGGYLAKVLRMPDYSWKIGVILFTLIVSVVMTTIKWPPKFGIDLSSGVRLIYEIDRVQLAQEKKKIEEVDINKLVDAIKLRVNPGGQKEVTIRPYGPDQIEIIIPNVTDTELQNVKEKISSTGKLEFRIVANTRNPNHRVAIEMAKNDPKKTIYTDSKGNWIARWYKVREGEKVSPQNLSRTRTENGKEVADLLVVSDVYSVTGDFLVDARMGNDQFGQPCVNFKFNTKGGKLFGSLTADNLPNPVNDLENQLAIVLDGTIYSYPNIKSQITEDGQITGRFTQEEVKGIVDVLNAGSLPAALAKVPVQEMKSGALLGVDTIRKSSYALVFSALVVVVFMMVYYRFSGIIAVIALGLNILGIVAVMITFNAAFTLTGFAALALTVGMAVDNNVLVYERMREELAKGAALRMAIRNAFNRVGATIVDCNMTHVIVAIVLWVMGSDQMRGFAIPLLMGVVFSMFTAVFVSHVLFDIAERHHWITELKMMHVIGHTSIDFMSIFPACLTFSIIITMLGLGAAVFRGQGLFDIDFTGGVSVQVEFEKPHDTEKVREALKNEEEMPDLAVSELRMSGDEEGGRRFNINTSRRQRENETEPAPELVKNYIKKTFGSELLRNAMEIKNLGPAVPSKAAAPSPAKEEIKLQTPVEEEESKAAPADKKSGEKPASDKQSRLRRHATSWFAAIAAAPLMFAQVDAAPAQTTAGPPAAEKAADTEPADTKSEDAKPAETKPADTKAEETKPADTKPAEVKSEETKAAEAKPADVKSEEAKAADTKLAETKAEEQKPAETKPAETKAAEDKPAETKPTDTTSSVPSVEELTAQNDPFHGGTQAELTFKEPVDHSRVEAIVTDAMKAAGVKVENIRMEITGEGYDEANSDTLRKTLNKWNIKLSIPPEQSQKILDDAGAKLASEPYFPSSNAIGSAVAGSTRLQALWAIMASWALIILYLWIRFQGVAFGLAAVLALVHDVLVALGGIAFSYWLAQIPGVSDFLLIDQFKINLSIIAAFLTIIGYSVNDTIVVFDRIREIRGKDPYLTRKMVNDATNQTLSRTIITSLTVFMVVVVLYVAGGPALRGFSFALTIGVLTGTYSSIYVAAPLLLWLVGKHKVTAEHPHYEPKK